MSHLKCPPTGAYYSACTAPAQAAPMPAELPLAAAFASYAEGFFAALDLLEERLEPVLGASPVLTASQFEPGAVPLRNTADKFRDALSRLNGLSHRIDL